MNQEKKMSGMLFKYLDNDNKEARSQNWKSLMSTF